MVEPCRRCQNLSYQIGCYEHLTPVNGQCGGFRSRVIGRNDGPCRECPYGSSIRCGCADSCEKWRDFIREVERRKVEARTDYHARSVLIETSVRMQTRWKRNHR